MLRISQQRIISLARLLGKLRIFRPLLEYCALLWIDPPWRRCRPQKRARIPVGNRNRNPLRKLAREFRERSPLRPEFLTLRGSFELPRAALRRIFLNSSAVLPDQSSQCPGPIVPSLYSVRVSVSSLVWAGDK